VSSAAAEGEKQARRMKFSDPAWESRFNQERQEQGLNRARWLMVLGLLVVCGIGMLEANMNARRAPEYIGIALSYRFLVVAPLWLVMLVSTGLPGHVRRADWVFASGTTLVCWALALNKWHYGFYFPRDTISTHVLIDVLVPLLVSSFALPMRFGPLAAMALAGTVVPTVFFHLTVPAELRRDAVFLASMLPAMGVLVVVLGWYREAGERRMFAQREQVRELNAELARLNAEKNEFMAIASHDLRAPLAAVRGLAEMLQAGTIREPAKQSEAHAAIHDAAGRMLGLVNDYLGTHAMETGTLPVQRTRLDLQAAAVETAMRHAPAAAAKHQRIDVVAGPVVWVEADAALLAQVTDNFVTNALKFSPAGAAVKLGIAAAEDGSVARFEVTDEGPGIAPGEQAKLFQKFSRASARPTAGETSHGLGLAVTKRLAESMGGRVGCDSEPGQGATFWIELPGAR
jgi:signal transduction histidine kinase